MNFETIIGLEVHVELKTNSKIFSPAPAHFGEDPNTNTNIIDWSFPGVLPVMNKGVIDYGIKAALALNMDIHQKMHFDRKNYFYPDNPKAYQISQFDERLKKFASSGLIWKRMLARIPMAVTVILMLTLTAKECR